MASKYIIKGRRLKGEYFASIGTLPTNQDWVKSASVTMTEAVGGGLLRVFSAGTTGATSYSRDSGSIEKDQIKLIQTFFRHASGGGSGSAYRIIITDSIRIQILYFYRDGSVRYFNNLNAIVTVATGYSFTSLSQINIQADGTNTKIFVNGALAATIPYTSFSTNFAAAPTAPSNGITWNISTQGTDLVDVYIQDFQYNIDGGGIQRANRIYRKSNTDFESPSGYITDTKYNRVR